MPKRLLLIFSLFLLVGCTQQIDVNCNTVCQPYYDCVESHGCTSQNDNLVTCREENCMEEECDFCEPYAEIVGRCTNFECMQEADICSACG